MDTNQLKYLIRNFTAMQTQVRFIEKYVNTNDKNNIQSIYYENKRKVEMLTDIMAILDDREKFIIQTHLVNHHTWTETTELFLKKFGYENEKSERTLKRLQNKALHKMVELINNSTGRNI